MIGVSTAFQVYVLPPMSDNPNLPFALPGHRVLSLEGPDAARFAHAQFMSDVAGLADGQWQWSGWLTPKGRVTALFALLRFDAQRVWLLLPDADPEALGEQLRRFIFRSKVAIGVVDMPVAGAFVEPGHGRPYEVRTGKKSTGVELDMTGQGGPRTLFLGGDPAPGDSAALERWAMADLTHGLPRLLPSQTDKWTPQQLSLERLRAFSVKKGCYPGQEIVARTHFLGQAKRRLALLETVSAVAPMGEVLVDGKIQGTIVTARGQLALAVLPFDSAGPFISNGAKLTERPLLGGLARGALNA